MEGTVCDSVLACWHAGVRRVLEILVRSQQDETVPPSMHLETVTFIPSIKSWNRKLQILVLYLKSGYP